MECGPFWLKKKKKKNAKPKKECEENHVPGWWYVNGISSYMASEGKVHVFNLVSSF